MNIDLPYLLPRRQWNSHPKKVVARKMQILIVLYALTNVFFVSSLRGYESPEDLTNGIGYLVTCLAFSLILSSAQLWTACLAARLPLKFRTSSCSIQVLTLILWHYYDSGSRLDRHGAYNILIFILFFIPLNICAFVIYLWYLCATTTETGHYREGLKRFLFQFIAVNAVFWISVNLYATFKTKALDYGFFGIRMPCGSTDDHGKCQSCQWEKAAPWFELLPFNLNFWTGPMVCPIDNSFTAYFKDDELLFAGCDSQATTDIKSYFNDSIIYNFRGPSYSILPRTEHWGLDLKKDSLEALNNVLQQNVLRYIERHTYEWHTPVKLDANIDAVVVRCGNAEAQIVNRISTPAVPRITDAARATLNESLNVVTLFVDAVSRPQFHRKLPMTRAVIEKLVPRGNEVHEFFRYHTVGLNTGPNTRALWAGLDELVPRSVGPPLWEQFARAGYVAARVDPMCQDWNAYYNSANLPKAPLSHEYLSWSCMPPYLPISKLQAGNFAGATSIKARCVSSTHVSHHSLDWASKFINAYSMEPYYINVAFMEGHEGTGAVLSTLDARLAAFLDPTTSPIDYANTAVVIVSDHGALMGLNFAITHNGRVEAAAPFAAMILPTDYVKKRHAASMQYKEGGSYTEANINVSMKRLITAHDIYETMRGFMGGRIDSSVQRTGDTSLGKSRRGVDMLASLLPDRSCTQAGIDEKNCRCHNN